MSLIQSTKHRLNMRPRIHREVSIGRIQPQSQFRSLYRWQGAQPGNDRVKVSLFQPAVPVKAHGRLELVAIACDTLRDGTLDLRVSPAADANLGVRGDVT